MCGPMSKWVNGSQVVFIPVLLSHFLIQKCKTFPKVNASSVIRFAILDIVSKDLKSTLRILYALFQKYKNSK